MKCKYRNGEEKKKRKKMKEPTGFESATFDQKARPIPA